jgi:hypothetical protein
MSADEFDPEIERLFARTPSMPDASLFTTQIEARLAGGARMRGVVLTAAGLVGGVVAVRETMNLRINLGSSDAAVTQTGLGLGVQEAAGGVQASVQGVLDQLGLAHLEFGSVGGMQLFWIAAAALIAVAAAGAMKLSQEI